MAIPILEKPKQEAPKTPALASPTLDPNLITKPDVGMSQKVAGKDEQPKVPTAPPATGQPTEKGNPGIKGIVPKAPQESSPTGSNVVSSLAPKPSATPNTARATPTSSIASITGGTEAPTIPTTVGAPPGVPNTSVSTPTIGLPPTPKSIQGQSAAEADLTQSQNEREQKLYEAALKYNGGPNSELETNRIKSEVEERNLTGKMGVAGTIESSLYNEGRGKIAQAEAELDERSYESYQKAVTEANDALLKAQIIFERASEQEKREMAEQAERLEQKDPINPPPPLVPTPQVPHGEGMGVPGNGPYAGSALQKKYNNVNVVRT